MYWNNPRFRHEESVDRVWQMMPDVPFLATLPLRIRSESLRKGCLAMCMCRRVLVTFCNCLQRTFVICNVMLGV